MAQVGKTKDDLVKLDEDLVRLVEEITEEYDREDRPERDRRRPLWLKLESFFHGVQRIYYNTVAKDWRNIDTSESARHYDKIINIYRAHAESIIAALSVKPPSAIFYPSDADVEEDITTAKACTKIKEDIEKYNQAQMLMIKSLVILFNQGVAAAYVYNRQDSKFGVYSTPKYSKDGMTVYNILQNCPECGSNIEEIQFEKEKGKVPEETKTCQVCGFTGIPETEEFEEMVPEIIGTTVNAKSKTQIEVFSPLFVYMPFYARRQEHCPYIRLRIEQHYAVLKNLYPKLKKRGFTPTIDHRDGDERGISVGNEGNLCTVDCWWVRPWAYDVVDGKDKEIERLKGKFPDGFYAIIIDDVLVEINNESLDNHWSITSNPLSTYIHADPLGKGLAPIQELENEILDLQVETFEHTIPETFARSDVLDFKKYSKSKSQPGMIFPAIPPAEGQSLGESFHSIKTASLSEEADTFMKRLDDKAQFVSSAFPSIYGGPATSGSKTAREYTESRAMALQRLSLPWNVVKYWWADVMGKAVPLYISAMKESGQDEKIVVRTKTGFLNTWIRQSDVEGNVGAVEADADENLPLTPAQLKDTVLQLLTLKDEFVSAAMMHPNNTPLLTKSLGAPDFYIPGSDSRDKQFAEFGDLLAGIPVEVTDTDEDEIEAEVCQSFINGPTGLMLKKSNAQGMQMIVEHWRAHMDRIAGKIQPAPGAVNPEGASPNVQIPSNVEPFPGPRAVLQS